MFSVTAGRIKQTFNRTRYAILAATTCYGIAFSAGIISILVIHFTGATPLPSEDEVVAPTAQPSPSPTVSMLLFHNGLILLFLATGAGLFGAPTVPLLSFNGYVHGIIVIESILGPLSVTQVVLLLIPHGIFEVPAVWIAGAAGLHIPLSVIQYLAGYSNIMLSLEHVLDTVVLLLVATVLVILSAFIEAYVTAVIFEMVFNSR